LTALERIGQGENARGYGQKHHVFALAFTRGPSQLHDNLIDYITRLSPNVRDFFLDKFVRALLRHRSAPEPGLQYRNWLPVLGFNPPPLGNLERSRQGAFHPREVIRLISSCYSPTTMRR
jgi:hypothetical protein